MELQRIGLKSHAQRQNQEMIKMQMPVALLRSRKSTPIDQSTVKWHRLECTFNISFMIQSANNPFKLKLFSP